MSILVQRFERYVLRLLPSKVRARLLVASAPNRAILRGMFWATVFLLLAKAVAAGKEMVVAWRYGTSATLEGYLLVFNIATWPVSLVYSIMHTVLVPWLVRQSQESPAQCLTRQRQVTSWVWLAGSFLAAVMALVLGPLIESGVMGLTTEGRLAALSMLPWMAVIVGFGIVASWHACQLMSAQRHVNSFLEAMPSFGVLVALLLWPRFDSQPLLWGTLAGFCAQVVLTVLAVQAAGMPIRPVWPLSRPLDTTVMGRATWLLAAQGLMSVAAILDQVVLAHLPQGNLSAYGYASRVMALVLTLSASVVGRAILPVVAGLPSEESYRTSKRWAWLLIWLGFGGSLLLAGTAQPVVALLFERGAFTEGDTRVTAQLLTWLSLQLPFYLVVTVWLQWASTEPRGAKVLWWAAVGAMAAKWSLVALLIGVFGWGAQAVAVGVLAAMVGYALVLIAFARRAFDARVQTI